MRRAPAAARPGPGRDRRRARQPSPRLGLAERSPTTTGLADVLRLSYANKEAKVRHEDGVRRATGRRSRTSTWSGGPRASTTKLQRSLNGDARSGTPTGPEEPSEKSCADDRVRHDAETFVSTGTIPRSCMPQAPAQGEVPGHRDRWASSSPTQTRTVSRVRPRLSRPHRPSPASDQSTPSASSAISVSRSRIWSSGSSPLWGVELISPKAACAIARARSGCSPWWTRPQLGGPHVDVLALQGPDPLARVGRQRLPVAVLDDDERAAGGARSRRASRRGRRARPRASPAPGHPLAADREQLLADRDQHLGEDRVLGREVLVERRPGDAARRADLGDRDPVEAAGGEQLGRGRQQLLAAGHRLGASCAQVSAR